MKIPIKIGILQCDSVIDEFQPQFGDYPNMFSELFKQVDPNIITQTYNIPLDEYPAKLNECDAYITTGSKASVYENLPWLIKFKEFIQSLHANDIKLIGICFGHQLIAETFGGKTEKSNKGWGVGVSVNRVILPQSWMQPPLEELQILVSHQDQVVRLPNNAILLASSDFCPNYMYQIKNTILSIQGHPEFSKEYSKTLMHYRALKIEKTTYQLGMNSLQLDTHEVIFTQWMLNFLTHTF